MVVLGIDPGLAIVGYGVIEADRGNFRARAYGTIKTPKDETLPVRLRMIEEGVKALIDKHKPDAISIEQLFFTKNITTGIPVAEARGVILLTCVKNCADLYEYNPVEIKQAITGYGGAEKQQMQQMTRILLGLREIPKPDDAADALAVALTHAQTSRLSDQFRIGNR